MSSTDLVPVPVVLDFKKFGFDETQVELIKDQICKKASDHELGMFLAHAHRLKLDPFAKQVYCVPRYDNSLGRMVYQPQTSIDGMRLVAERSGTYMGQLGPRWCGPDGKWVDVWLQPGYPSAAKVGVLKKGFAKPIWSVAIFRDYAQTTKEGKLTAMWQKFPSVMIAKCAESMSLRRAFPHDLSGCYVPEEMQSADYIDAEFRVGDDTPPPIPPVAPPKTPPKAPPAKPATYQGTTPQMKAFAEMAREFGLTDKAMLREMSAQLIGTDLELLKAEIQKRASKPVPSIVGSDEIVLAKQSILAELERQHFEWKSSDDAAKDVQMTAIRERQSQIKAMEEGEFLANFPGGRDRDVGF